MKTDRFLGPLFIIGTGRSGTKLLRDLLNQNPIIGIPIAETAFIPYMVQRFGNPPVFAGNTREFSEFYEAFAQTNFFWYMREDGRVLSQEALEKGADITSWSSIFEFILRFYAPRGRDEGFVWGDKTPGPSHIDHMISLKDLFPTARFLHIIRDPRDVCLSMKKAWGKSLYRAANVWCEEVKSAHLIGLQLGQDYKEVLYESLLEDPTRVLQDVCEFLGCEFIPVMTTLENPSENIGDAKGKTYIVRDNKKKYITQLSSIQIRRIEEIVCPIAKSMGYELEHDVAFKPLRSLELRMLMLHDAWVTLRFDIKEKGLYEGLRYFWMALKIYITTMFES